MKYTSYEIKKNKDFKNQTIKCMFLDKILKSSLLNPTFYIYSITHSPLNVYFCTRLIV